MPFDLPALPYERNALEPHLSAEIVDLHHGHLQRGHLERLHTLTKDTVFAEMPLEDIARKAQGAMAESAAQAWAMALYWNTLKPASAGGGGEPAGQLAAAINKSFGTPEGLRRLFNQAALRNFGPGWAWLLQRTDGRLAIAVTAHSATPLTGPDRILLACSLWEHAYILDYRNDRAKYLDAFWQLVDWDAVAARMA